MILKVKKWKLVNEIIATAQAYNKKKGFQEFDGKEFFKIASEASEWSLRKTLEYVHRNIKRAEKEDDTFYFEIK